MCGANGGGDPASELRQKSVVCLEGAKFDGLCDNERVGG